MINMSYTWHALDPLAQIAEIVTPLVTLFIWFFNYYHNRMISRDLPEISYSEIKNIKKYYIPTKYQNINPAIYDELSEKNDLISKSLLIEYFLKVAFQRKRNTNKYFIILADSGMGKTTFLINLFLKYKKKFLFINAYEIKYISLAGLDIDSDIEEIKNKKNTILLLDAFDEDTQAVDNYEVRLNELIEKTSKFWKVVLTCRTQFFSSEALEPNETKIPKVGPIKGFHEFHKLYISPFDQHEIQVYLRKKYSIINYLKRKEAFSIVKRSNFIMVRPMLLSYMDDLLSAGAINYVWSFQIYNQLIIQWIRREALKKSSELRGLFEIQLRKFSEAISLYIYVNRYSTKVLSIKQEDIAFFAEKYDIDLTFIEMKSRSLLNRNDSGDYKFAHKSILEYFLAELVFKNVNKFGYEFDFYGMDMTKLFYDEMYFNSITIPWLQNKSNDLSVSEKLSFKLTYENQWRSLATIKSNHYNFVLVETLKKSAEINCSHFGIDNILEFEVFSELLKLNLSNNKIKSIPRLVMNRLISLDLTNNEISDINNLSLNNIRYLYLSNNKVDSISELCKLKSLEELHIKNNLLDKGQLHELAASIPKCKLVLDEGKEESNGNYYEIYIKKSKSDNLRPGWSSSDLSH